MFEMIGAGLDLNEALEINVNLVPKCSNLLEELQDDILEEAIGI
jgi:hypothetical protein